MRKNPFTLCKQKEIKMFNLKNLMMLFGVIVIAASLVMVVGCSDAKKIVDSAPLIDNNNTDPGENSLNALMMTGDEARIFLESNGYIPDDCDTPDKGMSVSTATSYPRSSFVLSTPWMSQMPPKHSWHTDAQAWARTYNCGPAVAAMLGGKFNNGSTQPWIIDAQNRWMHHPLPYGSGTGASTMQSLLWNFHRIHSSSYIGNDADDVVMEGYHGRPVIVGVRTKMSATGGRSHWMLFVGYSNPYMYFHDPGRSSASNGRYVRYTINQFKASWTYDGKRYIPVWK